MKVTERDPRVLFVVGPERAETIRRQANEVVLAIIDANPDTFAIKAMDLDREIDLKIAGIEKEIASKDTSDEKKELLGLDKTHQESRRRTPDQLADEERERLYQAAADVLKGFHGKRMAGRLAHWQTTCRLEGCGKQPRTGRNESGHKSRRRNFVFCTGHAGVRNILSTRDYQRLQNNANLRVVAEE